MTQIDFISDLPESDPEEDFAIRLRLDVLIPIMGVVGEPAPTGLTAAVLAERTGHPLALVESMVEHLISEERIVTRAEDGTLHYRQRPWSEMYPEGREVFYEGDDPAGFAATVRERFGFDPSGTATWGETLYDGRDTFQSYAFHCPAEHLDALYGSGEYPLGS